MALDTATALTLANLAARNGDLDFIQDLREHLAAAPKPAGAPDAWSSPFLHAELHCALQSAAAASAAAAAAAAA
eukprot:SAG22_NODE_12925_length_424_cov_1.553846_1_plen_73_part_10